jgi:hypothetical protein
MQTGSAAPTAATPNPVRTWITRNIRILLTALVAGTVLAAFCLGWVLYGPVATVPLAAAVLGVAGLGALVGVSELVSRYTDAPEDALLAWPGLLYVTVNVLAACAAFGLAHGFDLLKLGDTSARLLTETLVAGIGAMAFFRSAVFTVRVGADDVAVGPASILQVIMNAVDRACDRERARPRAEFVSTLMNGVSFEAAANILPQFCFSAMQNVSVADQQIVLEWVKAIKTAKDIGDDQKTLLLGLRLLNIVGTEVLESTIKGLGPRIRASLKIDLTTVALLQHVDFNRSGRPLMEVCYALSQGSVAISRQEMASSLDNIGGLDFGNDVKVLLLASALLKAFGDNIVVQALRMVAPPPAVPPPPPVSP